MNQSYSHAGRIEGVNRMFDLWVSGARDAFGYRFRDAWHVKGWDQGDPPDAYVCWLPVKPAPNPPAPSNTKKPQLELF